MLQELVVENYAVVDRLRIRFHPGLNLLTGETGGGKSIVVDALGLLLGARASAEMIRTGESRAHVAGIFDVRDSQPIRRLLATAGIESDDGELLVEREILAGGKSRAFVGSRPVAVSLLKDLAPFLADIHGQHDQQLLFSPEAQRDMLDAFAAHRDSLDRAGAVFEQWRSAASELESLQRSSRKSFACSICGASSARKSKPPRSKPARKSRSKTNAASCRTSNVWKKPPPPPTPTSE